MATAAKRMEHIALVPATDPGWVLEDDVTMPESDLHDVILRLLIKIFAAWVRRLGRDASVRRNFALRWDPQQPRVGVNPDVMLIEPALPVGPTLLGLCTCKPGHYPPRVAVEIVSETTATKDYGEGLHKYAASGTRELWIFDPERWGPKGSGGPWVLQVWRRDPRGRFTRRYAGEGPAYSKELRAWMVVTDKGTRLRLADDREGQQLWLTIDEQERAEKLTERAAKEAALAREHAALAENEHLRAEIERLRGR